MSVYEQQEMLTVYLAELEENGGHVANACLKAGTTPLTIWKIREADDSFRRQELDSFKRAKRVAEDAAIQRAIHGVVTKRITKTLKNGEQVVAEEITYSDTALLRLLEKQETGSWSKRIIQGQDGTLTFETRAERKAAVDRARAEMAAGQAKLGEKRLTTAAPTEDQ